MTATSPGLVALRFAVALCLAWVAGCDGCHGARSAAPLATMLELRGDSARRDHAQSVEHWEHVDLRAKFWIGDGLRTDPPSSALLALADGAQLHVRTGTLIRFLSDGVSDGEQGIDVVTGEAVLNTGTRDMRLRTHVGLATLTAGSQLVLTREGDRMRMRLDVGEAEFRDDHDQAVKLAIGEGVLLNVGMTKVPEAARQVAAVTPPPSAAILAKVANDGVQTRDKGERAWRPLPRGDHALPAGTGLRLPAGTKVTLVRGNDSAELEGAGEYSLGDGPTWVEAQRGDVHVTALAQDIQVIVPGGRIIVHAADGGGEAGLRVTDDAGTLEVARGHVTFKDKDGAREVDAKAPYHWSFAAAAANDATENSASVDYENFGIAAGESFVVHAAEVPVALGIDFSRKCPGEGVVDLLPGRQRSRGTGHSNVLLPAGGRSYAVRCVDAHAAVGGIVARGTAQVLHDAGTRKLPPIAPTSEIEADGRSYTIFYQNQLPNVHVRWPNAPATKLYQLDVDGTPMSVPSPDHVFQSGSLGDGVHTIDFEAQGRKSRTATVTVRFDNTAPTASLSAPADRGFAAGDSVDIEGVALPAWKVSVQGGTISKVGDDRFRGQVVTSQEHPDIAVRLVHPRLGTHYYLRRASGSR